MLEWFINKSVIDLLWILHEIQMILTTFHFSVDLAKQRAHRELIVATTLVYDGKKKDKWWEWSE